jgi:C4-dicarboxylate-specific signal transduction histidine kinase
MAQPFASFCQYRQPRLGQAEKTAATGRMAATIAHEINNTVGANLR